MKYAILIIIQVVISNIRPPGGYIAMDLAKLMALAILSKLVGQNWF